ncbi:MAG TPA: thioredoxin domain-containing protein [Gemmatimonadaceae bacterium]|nr:thioredoxin domain-containing protein [Gemmatimonadaceae bacterium]
MAKAPVRKQNNRTFIGLLVLVGVVGVGALGYVLTRPGEKALTVDPSIPAGTAEGYLLGRPDAPVQVMEFGDFECPGCGNFANVTEPDVRARLVNTGIVAFRFFDFPLSAHRNSWTAHVAASCAADQGKFWEMHDRIYAGQNEWGLTGSGEVTTNPIKVFRKYATEIGLDVKKWEDCLAAKPHEARIKANAAEGMRRQINGTPTFIIGNKMLPSDHVTGYDEFKRYVDEALAAATKSDSGKKATRTAPPRKGGAPEEK